MSNRFFYVKKGEEPTPTPPVDYDIFLIDEDSDFILNGSKVESWNDQVNNYNAVQTESRLQPEKVGSYVDYNGKAQYLVSSGLTIQTGITIDIEYEPVNKSKISNPEILLSTDQFKIYEYSNSFELRYENTGQTLSGGFENWWTGKTSNTYNQMRQSQIYDDIIYMWGQFGNYQFKILDKDKNEVNISPPIVILDMCIYKGEPYAFCNNQKLYQVDYTGGTLIERVDNTDITTDALYLTSVVVGDWIYACKRNRNKLYGLNPSTNSSTKEWVRTLRDEVSSSCVYQDRLYIAYYNTSEIYSVPLDNVSGGTEVSGFTTKTGSERKHLIVYNGLLCCQLSTDNTPKLVTWDGSTKTSYNGGLAPYDQNNNAFIHGGKLYLALGFNLEPSDLIYFDGSDIINPSYSNNQTYRFEKGWNSWLGKLANINQNGANVAIDLYTSGVSIYIDKEEEVVNNLQIIIDSDEITFSNNSETGTTYYTGEINDTSDLFIGGADYSIAGTQSNSDRSSCYGTIKKVGIKTNN